MDAIDFKFAGNVLRCEADAIARAADSIEPLSFLAALEVLSQARCVHTTGAGKSGRVAQNIADLFSSIGRPATFLHPIEALHGDLGRVHRHDPILMFSTSGGTWELIRLAEHIRHADHPVVLVTAARNCPLLEYATIMLRYDVAELPGFPFIPICSSAIMSAIGHALTIAMATERRVTEESFRRWHPAKPITASM